MIASYSVCLLFKYNAVSSHPKDQCMRMQAGLQTGEDEVSVPSQRPMHAYAGPLAGLETGEGGYDEVSVPSQRPMHAYAGPLAGLQTGEGGYDEVSVPSQRPMHAYAGPLAGLQTGDGGYDEAICPITLTQNACVTAGLQYMRVGTMRYLSHPKDQCMRMQAR